MKVFYRIIAFFLSLFTLLGGLPALFSAPAMPEQTAVVKSDALNRKLYDEFYAGAQAFAVIPGLKEKMIPQGIAYAAAQDAFLVTGYYENGALPSVLCVLDGKTGALRKTLLLADAAGEPQTGHFGGIAAWEGFVYASAGKKLYVYEAQAVRSCGNGAALRAAAVYALPDAGSFCTAGNGLLLTGTFISAEDAKNADGVTVNGEKLCAAAHVYRLDAEKTLGLASVTKNKLVPAGEVYIPQEVQGAALTADGSLWLSASFGRQSDSRIYRFRDFDPAVLTETGTAETALTAKRAAETLTAPPMAEGMTACPQGAAVIFESGAVGYRLLMGHCPVDRVLILPAER